MLNGKEEHKWDDFAGLFNASGRDLAHRKHPNRAILDNYLHGVCATSQHDLPEASELSTWLAGEKGWTASAISAHILSCQQCTSQIKSLRIELEKKLAAKRQPLSWLQKLEEELLPAAGGIKSLKRPVMALLLLVFFVGVLFAVQQPTYQENFQNQPSNAGSFKDEGGGLSASDTIEPRHSVSRVF